VALSTATFAVIGDFGKAGTPESDVAALVHGWNPDFILTVGDNNYETGSASDIDANIGQYYHDYISPYVGHYGSGAASNRFFPILGNHDWGDTYPNPNGDQPYLNYFTLPGNERYYSITMGPVQFFGLDDDPNEPDGTSITSQQAMWLQSQLAASTATYKLVAMHHPPYCSSSGLANPQGRWPYQAWGATAVLSGHCHGYERLTENSNFPYVIDGLGGDPDISPFDALDPGSQVRYNADFGAMLVTANDSQMQLQFITRTGTVIDSYTISAPVKITTATLPNCTVNQPGYSQTISATGGTGTLKFSVTAGTVPTGLTLSSTGVLSGTPTTKGSFTFTVTATDTTGASGSKAYAVVVYPAATRLTITVPSTASAGTSFNLVATATDSAGQLAGAFSGTVTLSSTAGPDIAPTSVLLSGGIATVSVTLIAAGSQTLAASYPGLTSGTASITVNPGPLGQFQVMPVSTSFRAGSSFLVSVQAADSVGNPITSYSGPASVTASISPDGPGNNLPGTVTINSNGLGLFLVSVQKAGSYTFSVTDSMGTHSGTSLPVSITAGAPVLLAFAAQPVSTPTGVTLPAVTVQVQDAYGNVVTSDNTDTVSLSVSRGPGSFTPGSTTAATVVNGVTPFSNLALTKPGTYQLSAVVPGLYTGPNSMTFTIAPLQVAPGSFTGTPTGFSLQFNAPFLVNSLTPALYGSGFGVGASVTPTVTLTQISGTPPAGTALPYPVPGSLIVNTSNNSLTFVETDTADVLTSGTPLLPDGTYVTHIMSRGANGLQALDKNGGFLDGLQNGIAGSGDFTATFSANAVAAGEDVVWVPATANGPGQALSAPGQNQKGTGYPVYLDDHTGAVTDVQLTLNYDPALLTVSGVTGGGFTLLGSTTPGHAVLEYSGPALPTGIQTPLGYLVAQVPSGTASNPMPYKAKNLLTLSGISINGGAIPAVAGNAVHLVAYVGDADGNGSYSANDAVLITRALLSTDSGFAAYPLVDPLIVADTDGSGFIPADAALQANEAGTGLPTANLAIPPIPAGVHFQAPAETSHPRARSITEVFRTAVQTGNDMNSTNRSPATPQPMIDVADLNLLLDSLALTPRARTAIGRRSFRSA
jgi:hypothetical protein